MLVTQNRKLEKSIVVFQKHGETARELSRENTEISIDQDNFGNSLILLRDKIKEIVYERTFRHKSEDVFYKFNGILRDHLQNKQRFYDLTLKLLMDCVGAETGVLHIAADNPDGKTVLKSQSCYAFDRKKFIRKELLPGEGPAGQAYLEAETVYLTDIPADYPKIGSATGRALPRNIVIIPLKYSKKVLAVVELAGFRIADSGDVSLAEQVGENIASALSSLHANERAAYLLRKSQTNEERLQAQAEELRQSLEELHATQEEMLRKQSELSEANRKSKKNSEEVERSRQELHEKAGQIARAETEIEEQKRSFVKLEKKLSATEIILKKAGEKHRIRVKNLEQKEKNLVEKERVLRAEIELLKKQIGENTEPEA